MGERLWRRHGRIVVALSVVVAAAVVLVALIVNGRTSTAKVRLVPGAIELGAGDYGKQVSAVRGQVLQVILPDPTGHGWQPPSLISTGVLAPLSVTDPPTGTLSATFRAVGNGSTKLAVEYRCKQAACSAPLWDTFVTVSDPPVKVALPDNTNTLHVKPGTLIDVTLPPLGRTGWVAPISRPPGIVIVQSATYSGGGPLNATFRADRPGTAVISTHYVCGAGACSVAGWSITVVVAGTSSPTRPVAVTAPPLTSDTATGINLDETDSGRTVDLRTDEVIGLTLSAQPGVQWGPLTMSHPGILSKFAGNVPGTSTLEAGLETENEGMTVLSSTLTCAASAPPGCSSGRWYVTVVVSNRFPY